MPPLLSLPRNAWRWARRRPILTTVIVVALAGGSFAASRQLSRRTVSLESFFPVKRGDFMISVIEGGTIKAVHEVTVRCELEGVSRIISIAPEGNYAKKGDLLVELDSSDLRDRLSAQEVTYQSTQFAYVQARENLAIQQSIVDSNIKDAELKAEFAGSDLQKYIEGDYPQALNLATSKITIVDEELKRAEDRMSWTEKLSAKNYATKAELEADSLAVKRKRIELEQASEEKRLLEKYDRPKRVRLLEANFEQAKKELARVKQRSAAQIAQYEADLKARNSTLELQLTRLNQLKEQLKLTKIYAPQDGLIIYASSSNPGNGVLIEEGASVRQRQDIIKLPDITQMMIEIRVHESHVQKVRPGLPAWVTIDSVPDQQFRGVVRKVGVLPDSSSRWSNPTLKVYITEILIQDELPDLKPGISGRAEVVITNILDTLSVPIQAVTTVKGKQVCLVETEGVTKPVPVEVGSYSDRMIEIKSGLKEGDRVLLSPQSSSDNIDLAGSIVTEEKKNELETQSHSKTNGESATPATGETNQAPAAPAVTKSSASAPHQITPGVGNSSPRDRDKNNSSGSEAAKKAAP